MKILPVSIFVSLVLFTSCRSDQSRVADQAEKDGATHAAALIEAQPMDEMKLQYLVLEVRSNAAKLRENGYETAADRYLESFEKTITEECDSLATIIFSTQK